MHIEQLTPKMGVIISADKVITEPTPSPEEILALVSSHGVAVFRGFPLDLDGFFELSEQISPGMHRGVGEQTNALMLHGEVYFIPHRIDLLWFYCVTPPLKGGATTVCDGVRVADELSPTAYQFFDDNLLIYDIRFFRQFWTQKIGDVPADQAARTLQTDMGRVADEFGDGCSFSCEAVSADLIHAVYRRKAIIPSRWGNRMAFVNTLLHALDPWASSRNEMYSLVTHIPPEIVSEVEEVTERLTEEINWSAGDFAVVDNSRLQHGRRAYEGPRNIQAINGVLPG